MGGLIRRESGTVISSLKPLERHARMQRKGKEAYLKSSKIPISYSVGQRVLRSRSLLLSVFHIMNGFAIHSLSPRASTFPKPPKMPMCPQNMPWTSGGIIEMTYAIVSGRPDCWSPTRQPPAVTGVLTNIRRMEEKFRASKALIAHVYHLLLFLSVCCLAGWSLHVLVFVPWRSGRIRSTPDVPAS